MRIGIMLQSFDETMGGIGVYTQEILRCPVAGRQHQRVHPHLSWVWYRAHAPGPVSPAQECDRNRDRISPDAIPKSIGIELGIVRTPRVLQKMRALVPLETYWDQVVVPRVAEQYGVDVVFNPSLTVPIRGRFGKVMVMHNVEYHTVPNVYTGEYTAGGFLLETVILPAADRMISLSNAMTADVPQVCQVSHRSGPHDLSRSERQVSGGDRTATGWRAPGRNTICRSVLSCLSVACIRKRILPRSLGPSPSSRTRFLTG